MSSNNVNLDSGCGVPRVFAVIAGLERSRFHMPPDMRTHPLLANNHFALFARQTVFQCFWKHNTTFKTFLYDPR